MKTLDALITVLSIPLMMLNILGGTVAGIWLAILGEWGTIVDGILLLIFSFISSGFVLMPSMLFTAPAIRCAEKGKTTGALCFAALSSLYILAVITLWCCGILFLFVHDATASNLIPRLLWSYGLATAPWAYIAGQDARSGDAFASMLVTFFAELAYLTIMVLIVFFSITILGAIKVFAGFMAVTLVIQITLSTLIQREMKAAEQSYEPYL
jgi:hypothetical protein